MSCIKCKHISENRRYIDGEDLYSCAKREKGVYLKRGFGCPDNTSPVCGDSIQDLVAYIGTHIVGRRQYKDYLDLVHTWEIAMGRDELHNLLLVKFPEATKLRGDVVVEIPNFILAVRLLKDKILEMTHLVVGYRTPKGRLSNVPLRKLQYITVKIDNLLWG